VRAIGVRRFDIGTAERRDLVVSEIRGQCTVSLLLAKAGGKTVAVPLAIYSAAGGVELGVFGLRRLADALAGVDGAGGQDARNLSALLVAQLRAEARGESPLERPLRLAAGLVPAGRLLRKVNPSRLAALVSELG
jgi:putative intracellular protease/amidase